MRLRVEILHTISLFFFFMNWEYVADAVICSALLTTVQVWQQFTCSLSASQLPLGLQTVTKDLTKPDTPQISLPRQLVILSLISIILQVSLWLTLLILSPNLLNGRSLTVAKAMASYFFQDHQRTEI